MNMITCMTKQELANKLNISTSTLSRKLYEKGLYDRLGIKRKQILEPWQVKEVLRVFGE